MNKWLWAMDSTTKENIKAGKPVEECSAEDIKEEIKSGNVLFKPREDVPYIFDFVMMRIRVVENKENPIVVYDAERMSEDISINYSNGRFLSLATNRSCSPAELVAKDPALVVRKYVMPYVFEYQQMPDNDKCVLSTDAETIFEWLKDKEICKDIDKENTR